MNNEIEINLEKQGEVTIFDMRGDLTALAKPFINEAYQKANEQGMSKILLKFYESSYITSGGIVILLWLLKEAKRNNQKVFITGLSNHYQKIFDIAGISKLVRIFNSVKEAMDNMPG